GSPLAILVSYISQTLAITVSRSWRPTEDSSPSGRLHCMGREGSPLDLMIRFTSLTRVTHELSNSILMVRWWRAGAAAALAMDSSGILLPSRLILQQITFMWPIR